MSTNAMHVAKTGLNAQQVRMQVIANNLSNVNTNDLEDENFSIDNFNYIEDCREDYNIEANRLNYDLNYNMKQLNFLSNFYKLKPEKKNKI